MRPVATLDHAVVNVRDRLDAAAERYRRLGFMLAPRGQGTQGPAGHLAVLGTDYLELLGTPPANGPEGLGGLAFKAFDAGAARATLAVAGVPVHEPEDLSRPGGAGFRIVEVRREAAPAGRLFLCHHLTPELIWRDEWRRHPNGALGIEAAVIAAGDPARLAALLARMFGAEAMAGATLRAGLARVEVVTPAALAERFGDGAAPAQGRPEWMAALVLRTASLDRAEAALRHGGMPCRRVGDRLLVAAATAFGVSLEFRE